MRATLTVVAATVVSVVGCGGGSGTPAPAAPGGSSAPPPGTVVINVVGINGTQSFSPNPTTVPSGQMVVWHNVDTVAHRVVFNDSELDTGTIDPGGFSTAMSLVAPGPYHCSFHPPMVGAVVAQ
jgi:plastocyanin